jgi:hypothetical protein
MRRCFSSGDDPDYFLILLSDKGIGDEDYRDSADQTHCLPALFSIDDSIQEAEGEGIVKDKFGGFKTYLVLCDIAPVLVLVPCVSHVLSDVIVCTFMYVQIKYREPCYYFRSEFNGIASWN